MRLTVQLVLAIALMPSFVQAARTEGAAGPIHIATYVEVGASSDKDGIKLLQQYRDASRKDAGNMRSDQRFMVPDNQNHRLEPTRCGFLHGELNQRLAGNWKHFLGQSLGYGQHPRAETRCGDHRLHNFLVIRCGRSSHRGFIVCGRPRNQKIRTVHPDIKRSNLSITSSSTFSGVNHSTHRSLRKAAETLWWILPKWQAGTNSEEE